MIGGFDYGMDPQRNLIFSMDGSLVTLGKYGLTVHDVTLDD